MNATESKSVLEQFTVLERAVLYGRVSYDDRDTDGRNLKGQIEMGRERANEKGYRIVDELPEDEKGASGAEIDLPKLNKIREMARAGEFDVLVVRELDRLSRNLAKQLIVEEELSRAGVRIEYVLADYDDSPEGRLQKHIRATVAEYEREKVKERMMRGRRQKVKSGSVIVGGRPPYGYRLVKNPDGKFALEIEESEARIVRLIFEWYTRGENGKPLSIYEIGLRLSEMVAPTPADTKTRKKSTAKKKNFGEWGRSTIQRILSSETYCGVWHYGKKTDSSGKWESNPIETLIAVEVPAIVSRDVWEVAQARRSQNKQDARRNMKNEYLLSKRLTCGGCGHKMAGQGAKKLKYLYLYYGCPEHSNRYRIEECSLPNFRADRVDTTVWNWVEEVCTDGKKLERGIRGYQAEMEKETNPLIERLKMTEEMIAEKERELSDAMANLRAVKNPEAKKVFGAEVDRIQALLDSLKQKCDEMQAKLKKVGLTESQILTIYQFAEQMRQDIELFRKDFESRRLLLEEIDLQATLFVENGVKMVEVSAKIGRKRLSVVSNSIYAIIINQI